jgi:hypothetical protein
MRERFESGRWSTRPYTKEEAVADLQRWSEAHGGRIPRANDLRGRNRAPGYVGDGTVIRLFGSFADGVDAAFGAGTADRTRQKGNRAPARSALLAVSVPWLAPAEARRVPPPTAAAFVPRRVEWVWRKRIPRGMVSLAVGPPGASKSLLGIRVAADVSVDGQVILCAAEDDIERAVVPRLMAANARLDAVTVFGQLGEVGDLDELEGHAGALEALAIVLDPLTAYVPAGRRGLLRLALIAQRTGAAVFALHHVTKSGRNPLERVGGPTGGAAGTARAIYVFGPEPDRPITERVLAVVKTNIAAPPDNLVLACDFVTISGVGQIPALRPTSSRSDASAQIILAGPEADDPDTSGPVMAAVAEWLTCYLQAGDRPRGEVIEDAGRIGISERSIAAAAKALGVPTGKEMRLPADHPLREPAPA